MLTFAVTMSWTWKVIGGAMGIFSTVVIIQAILENHRDYQRKRRGESPSADSRQTKAGA